MAQLNYYNVSDNACQSPNPNSASPMQGKKNHQQEKKKAKDHAMEFKRLEFIHSLLLDLAKIDNATMIKDDEQGDEGLQQGLRQTLGERKATAIDYLQSIF